MSGGSLMGRLVVKTPPISCTWTCVHPGTAACEIKWIKYVRMIPCLSAIDLGGPSKLQ